MLHDNNDALYATLQTQAQFSSKDQRASAADSV